MSDTSSEPDQPSDTTRETLLGVSLSIGVIVASVTLVCCLLVLGVVLVDQLSLWCALPFAESLFGCP